MVCGFCILCLPHCKIMECNKCTQSDQWDNVWYVIPANNDILLPVEHTQYETQLSKDKRASFPYYLFSAFSTIPNNKGFYCLFRTGKNPNFYKFLCRNFDFCLYYKARPNTKHKVYIKNLVPNQIRRGASNSLTP